MVSSTANSEIRRSFPEAREFLLSEIAGPDYPVKHLIEQSRNKGYITRGKAGRGGGAVTSRDMAMLLSGTLAGDTPQTATDAMEPINRLVPFVDFFGAKPPPIKGLLDDWWDRSLVDVVAMLIDAWRNKQNLDFYNVRISLDRAPSFQARISWPTELYEQEEFLLYHTKDGADPQAIRPGHRTISASYTGNTLMLVADWLEGRESY